MYFDKYRRLSFKIIFYPKLKVVPKSVSLFEIYQFEIQSLNKFPQIKIQGPKNRLINNEELDVL